MPPSLTLRIFVRSCLFQAAVAIAFLVSIPVLPVIILLAPRDVVKQGFERTIYWYLRFQTFMCGQTYELRGVDNIPFGPVLFASKHLSKWDSAVLPVLLGNPAVVLRRGMLRFPIYGNVIARMDHLIVPRSPKPADVENLLKEAKSLIEAGRSVLIFPEGTRRSAFPYSPPAFKRGVTALYRTLHVPCVPVALNSGLFWPRNSWIRYPGKIVAEILAPIAPGLGSLEFTHQLVDRIETNSRRLVTEGLAASTTNLS